MKYNRNVFMTLLILFAVLGVILWYRLHTEHYLVGFWTNLMLFVASVGLVITLGVSINTVDKAKKAKDNK